MRMAVQKEIKMYKLVWQSTDGQYRGEGEPSNDLDHLLAWRDYGNKQQPHLKHEVVVIGKGKPTAVKPPDTCQFCGETDDLNHSVYTHNGKTAVRFWCQPCQVMIEAIAHNHVTGSGTLAKPETDDRYLCVSMDNDFSATVAAENPEHAAERFITYGKLPFSFSGDYLVKVVRGGEMGYYRVSESDRPSYVAVELTDEELEAELEIPKEDEPVTQSYRCSLSYDDAVTWVPIEATNKNEAVIKFLKTLDNPPGRKWIVKLIGPDGRLHLYEVWRGVEPDFTAREIIAA